MKKILSLILLLLELITCGYCETCPLHAEIYPCTCQETNYGLILFSCRDNSVDLEDLKKILKSLTGKKNVKIMLDGIDLGKVPSDFFSGIRVRRLTISNCILDSLESEDGKPAFSGLEDTLEQLTIDSCFSESNLSTPSKLKLGHLNHLSYLDLTGNFIPELDNDWFEGGPTSLNSLYISQNEIRKLGDKAFANLPNLKNIYIDGNRFGNVQRSMLPSSAEALKDLELDNNAFDSLPEDIFADMPSLNKVALRNNKIARLEESTWKPVWEQLNFIILEGNPLQCDSHMHWMFNLRVTSYLTGICIGRNGLYLRDFIKKGKRERG